MLYNETAQMNVRTDLNSPGDISFQIILDGLNTLKDYVIPIVTTYVILFGGSLKIKNCEIKTIGVINFIKKVVDRTQNRKTYKLKRKNEKKKEKLKGIQIKNQTIEEKIKNKKLNADLRKLEMAEENEQKILEAIHELGARSNNNIVDLNNLIQDNQDILDDNA